MTNENIIEVLKGGKGSGDFGHTGRAGKRGGSGGGGGKGKPRRGRRSREALDKEIENLKDYTGTSPTRNEIFKRYDKWSIGLKDSFKDAISDYSSTDLYEVINDSLRKGTGVSDVINNKIRDLDDAIRKAPSLSEETKLYRVTDSESFSGLNVGDKFTDKGFGSTTLDRNQIVEFSDGNIEMVIIASPKTKGAYVAGLSAFSQEAEFILKRNTRYEILDIRPGDGSRFDKQYIVEIQ